MIKKCNAKVNLTLDVVGQREDGYHLLRSVMQPVPIYDTLLIRQETEGISLSCNLPYIPVDKRNLVYRAAALFFEKTGVQRGISIKLEKQIPIGAGLGGGSSNAAATLLSLNELFHTSIPVKLLCEWSSLLGADVPFFILNQTQLAEGIGEKLTPVPSLPPCEMLLIMPDFPVNTKWAYEQLSGSDNPCKTEAMLSALAGGEIEQIAQSLGNHLEDAVRKKYPQIIEIKEELISNGALGATMTGSGSAVFGIFQKGTDTKPLKSLFKNCTCFHLSMD